MEELWLRVNIGSCLAFQGLVVSTRVLSLGPSLVGQLESAPQNTKQILHSLSSLLVGLLRKGLS